MEFHQQLFDYLEVLIDTDVRKISITSDGLCFVIGEEQIMMFVPQMKKRAPLEIMNFDKYEPNESRLIDKLSSEAKQIIDIGANIGYYTIRFAKKYQSQLFMLLNL